MRCLVCHNPLDGTQPCSRCGFKLPLSFGDAATVQKLQEQDAEIHRRSYLREFDFGFTSYYWDDKDGVYVLNTAKPLSLGTGEDLLEQTRWLDLEFSRLGNGDTLSVTVSIRQGNREYTVPVQIPELDEPLLQQLGLSLHNDPEAHLLGLTLHLRNKQRETASALTAFLPD